MKSRANQTSRSKFFYEIAHLVKCVLMLLRHEENVVFRDTIKADGKLSCPKAS